MQTENICLNFEAALKVTAVQKKKNHTDSMIENVSDPTLKTLLKYRKHLSILEIKRIAKGNLVFTSNHITKEDVSKEIKKLQNH